MYYYMNRLTISAQNQRDLIEQIHTADIFVTYQAIYIVCMHLGKRHYWIQMRTMFADFVRNCAICSKYKFFHGYKIVQQVINKGNKPRKMISVDLFGFGKLTNQRGFVECLTKWAILFGFQWSFFLTMEMSSKTLYTGSSVQS